MGLLFLLAALPVLALHLLKPRRAEVTVSSSMLWEDETVGATAASPWQRLPPTLLLLLQLLLVVLGALLLADPVVRGDAGLAEHTVVVLDTSASMGSLDGEPDRFVDAQTQAIALFQEIPRGGRVSLVTAGPTPRVRVSATSDVETFEGAVRAVRLSDGPADLRAAMALADGLETPDAQLGIVLISDGAHTAAELAALPTGVTHRLVGSTDVNHAITSLQVTRTEDGLEVTAISEVTGGGAVAVPLRFDVDDVTRAVIDIEIEPGTPTITQVPLPDGERVIARLGGDDLLAIDNTAYAVTRSRTDLAVSVHGELDPFLQTLLGVVPGVELVDPEVDTPEISIYSGVAVPEDITRPFIAIAPPAGVPGVTVVGDVENPAVTLVRSADPLLTGLDLSRLRIANAQQVSSPTAEVLVAAEGAPLVLRGQRGGVPFLYLSFAVGDSTLPVELAFPVLGQRMLEELSGAVIIPAALEVGDPIVPPAGRDVTITAPNGTERVRAAGSGSLVADRPGFWTIQPTDGALRTVAVSLGPEESQVDPLPVAPTDPRPLRPGEDPPQSENSWRWLVAVIALAIGVFEWLESRRRRGVPRWQWRTASVLRIAAAAMVILALLGASLPLRSDDVSTVFVLDRSDSVGRLGTTVGLNASQRSAVAAPDDGRLGVVVSGDGARIEQLLVPVDQATGLSTATIDGDRSDLAAGLRLAGALLPEDTKRRVVVVSDGRVTTGDAESEAAALGERGIPVDYILLEPAEGADAAVVGLSAPSQVDEGAQVPIEITIESTAEQPALVTLRRNGEPIGSIDTLLQVGTNRVTFTDDPGDTGVVSYSATVDTAGDARPQNDTARTTVDIDGPAQVLLVEGTSEAGDALDLALRSSGLEVDVIDAAAVPALDQLIAYDSVILADVSLGQLSDDQIQSIATATQQLGRGLVTIGGPQSYGMGSYRNSELEQVLPVISDVLDPQRLRQVAQVMALDTSESMGECHCADGFENPTGEFGGVNKTAIARAGAARAIANLNANDEIGVLAVDTQERWLIDLQQLPSDDVIDSGLAQAVPSGNTELAGTLPTAADALRESNAALKHIILFTDGFTSEGDLELMRQQAADIRAEGVTISVVATGEGAANQLAAIAEAGGGRFYPGRDLTRIPEILVQESVLASRQFINEGEFLPIVTDTSPVVDGLSESPALLGYVATTSKDTARTLLRIGPDEDPLLASWRIGLGRATSWTSDASPRWSQFWTGWDGYVDFWGGVVRDTFPVQTTGAVRTSVDGDTLRIRAEATAGQGRVDAIVSTPDGDQTDVRLREVSPGVFEGEVSADGAGTYAVGVSGTGASGEETLGSAIASVSYAAEYRPGPADEALLQRLSELSGGRGAIDAAQAFDADELVSGRRSIDLANWFLIAATLAWLAAVVFSRLWLRRTQVALSEVPAAAPKRRDTPRSRRAAARSAAEPSTNAPTGSAAPSASPPAAAPPPQAPPSPPPPPAASAATVNELLKARRKKDDS
jgi:uncharacterized membrane protein